MKKLDSQQSVNAAIIGYVKHIPKGATYVITRSTAEKTVVSYWFNGQQVVKEFPPERRPDPDLPDDL